MRRNDSGFSMVEVTIATAVAGTMMGITVAAMESTLPGWRAQEGATGLVATVRAARRQAVSEGRPVAVVFDYAGGTYGVVPDPDAANPPAGTPPSESKLPAGLRWVVPPGQDQCPLPPDSALRVGAKGRLVTASPAYVYFGNPGREIFRRARVDFLGEVTVERWEGGAWRQ